MYYGNPERNTGMYHATLDEAEDKFRVDFIKVPRIPTDIGNVKRRLEAFAEKWEVTKNRAALNGARFYRCEDEYLEHGGPLAWDEFNDYLRYGADLRPRFAGHLKSKYDDNIERGAA